MSFYWPQLANSCADLAHNLHKTPAVLQPTGTVCLTRSKLVTLRKTKILTFIRLPLQNSVADTLFMFQSNQCTSGKRIGNPSEKRFSIWVNFFQQTCTKYNPGLTCEETQEFTEESLCCTYCLCCFFLTSLRGAKLTLPIYHSWLYAFAFVCVSGYAID